MTPKQVGLFPKTLQRTEQNGTKSTVINDSYVDNIFVQNDMLIYSDHNRQDKLYAYDLKNNVEKCISEDMCWDTSTEMMIGYFIEIKVMS